MATRKGGLQLNARTQRGDIRLILRNADRKVLDNQIVKAGSNQAAKIVVPMEFGRQAFLEVEPAKQRGNAEYQILLQPVSVSDRVFTGRRLSAGIAQPNARYRGTVSSDIRTLFAGLEITRTAELQAVLSQMSAEATMTIIDSRGNPLPDQRLQTGLRDRIFKRVLPKGRYYARISYSGESRGIASFAFSFKTETRTQRDLNERDLALSRMIELSNSEVFFESSIDERQTQAFFQYTAKTDGLHFVKVSTETGSDIDLFLEDEYGSALSSNSTIGNFEAAAIKLKSQSKYRIIIKKKSSILNKKTKYKLYINPTSTDDKLFADQLIRRHYTILDKSKDWWIYRIASTCGTTTPIINRAGTVSIYYSVNKKGNTFGNGMYGAYVSSDGYVVSVKNKGKWLTIYPKMQGEFMFSVTLKDGKSIFSHEIGAKLINSTQISI